MSMPFRVLIVDDDRMMAKTLADILRFKQYDVEIAYSGQDALVRFNDRTFDCLISDIKMPEMTGVELCQRVKHLLPQLPVILMTAYSENDMVRQGLDEGAAAVLTKPLKIHDVLEFLKEFGMGERDNDR